VVIETPPIAQPKNPRITGWTDVIGLTLVFGLLFFCGLRDVAFVNPDEGRYAEVPREMISAGDYVTPRLNGVLYFEKPPLVYWSIAGMIKVFGEGELAARSVPALFALLGVLVAYGATRELYGRVPGLAAAIVVGSSLLYFALGRILLLDMAVSVLMSATLFCFIAGVRQRPGTSRRRWFFYGLYVSAALATLAKGLIGFLLPGAVMFFWLLIFNQWSRLRPLFLPSGVALFLAIAAPWHVLVAQRNPGWAQFYFVREHWERFTTTEHGRMEPWWYFIPIIAVGLFPWSGFLWSAVRRALAGGWARRKQTAEAWFFATWAVFLFLFFSKSQSKLVPYILPVFPPLAVMIGCWLAEVWHRKELGGARVALWVFSVSGAILSAALFVVLLKTGLVADAAKLAPMKPGGLLAATVLLVGVGVVIVMLRRNRARGALLAMAISVAGFYLTLGVMQDKIVRPGTKALALKVKEKIQPGDRVYHYHDFFHDFTYYTQRTVGTVAAPNTELEIWIDQEAQASGRFVDDAEFLRQWAGPQRLWVVARRRAVDGTLFSDPAFHYHLLGETAGHYLFSNQP
jgi:4-amino-4-deoxy-L-arabinose transferase-like glycosyltransferase